MTLKKKKKHKGLKPQGGRERVYVEKGPFKKPTFPADTHFLFCDSCKKMYENYQYAPNHIVVVVHSNAKGNQAKGMMPLLKAWAAFIEHFSGHTVTFTIGKPEESTATVSKWITNPDTGKVEVIPVGSNELVGVDETKLKDALNSSGILRYSDIIYMKIIDEPKDYAMERVNPSYAYMYGIMGNLITFKTGVLLSFSPGATLTYMAHEFTAHRYDKDHSIEDKNSPDYLRFTTHYKDENGGHCLTSPRMKNKCLNGFIDFGYANFKNAESFFTDWYNKHKGHKITMFDTSAPAPAPRTVSVPGPPPSSSLPPPPPPKKKKPSVEEEAVPEELLEEFKDGDAPPEEAPEAPEDPCYSPQAFLDAAPIIADPNNIQAIEERGYDG